MRGSGLWMTGVALQSPVFSYLYGALSLSCHSRLSFHHCISQSIEQPVPTALQQDEKELLRRIAGGDEAAFTVLFDAYKDRIYTIAFRLTSMPTVAEEVVQDIFLKIWLKREGLLAVEYFRAYLFTATRNEVFNTIKRLSRRRLLAVEWAGRGPAETSDTDALLLDKEYQAILQEAVERLPPQQQQVYRLMKEQGLNREEVAAQLGIAPQTVKAHLAQAMRSVRAFCVARLDLYIALILFDSFRK
jgi:RNA polymerase sigma-70 factor (family 1)